MEPSGGHQLTITATFTVDGESVNVLVFVQPDCLFVGNEHYPLLGNYCFATQWGAYLI